LTGRVKAMGAKPSIGSDTEVYVAADMFHTMRFTLQYQQSIDCKEQAVGAMPIDKLATTPREALEWATIEGARALQMEDKIGSLTPGKKADIVLIDGADICLAPINDPVNAVVQFADRSNVDTVLIGGKVVKTAGKLTFDRQIMLEKQAALAAEIQSVFEDADYRHQAS
jgi:5-methylthioadenosine/S-adenosylhomocysteine deaminase